MASPNPPPIITSDSDEDPDYEAEADEEEDSDYASDAAAAPDDDVLVVLDVEQIPGSEGNGDGEGSSSSAEAYGADTDIGVDAGGGGAVEGPSPSGSLENDRSMSPNCPVCFEPWAPEGPHRVCCIPCGHVYGRSCLQKWIQRCGKMTCPLCIRKFKQKEIVNLYAPLIAVRSDELEKEVRTLREKNELLQFEKARLVEEISRYRKQQMDNECSERSKRTCLEHASSEPTRRRIFGYCDERLSSSQIFLENSSPSQNYTRDGYHNCSLVLQNELALEGARVMGIDAHRQILLVSCKRPGLVGEHVLNKISLLAPCEIHKIILPPNTGAIRDMCILPNGLTLFASLGKNLSLFSMESNNLILKYDLPGPAWSCSGDYNNQYHIYAGLQNGMLLLFDTRQTATPLESMEGLSRHPIHTIHSIVQNDNIKKVLTASSLGPCVWDVGGSGERPFLVPEMDNHGICIALACGSSTDDIVASFRPKVELQNNTLPSQFSVSSSPAVSRPGKLGSHVLIKRVNGVSFQKQEVAVGSVSEARMSKSAVIWSEGNNPLFAYGDESSHGVCLWDLPSLQVYRRLKPHEHPILDLKYSQSTGPGFLGCISENRLQIFTCF